LADAPKYIVKSKIQQTWWHLDDIYVPHPARRIRQVMDLFTDGSTYTLGNLNNEYFVGLKVITRNGLHKEIAFLESSKEGKIIPKEVYDLFRQIFERSKKTSKLKKILEALHIREFQDDRFFIDDTYKLLIDQLIKTDFISNLEEFEDINLGEFNIILNFDPIDNFPDAPAEFTEGKKFKHIKFEVEYILTRPDIIRPRKLLFPICISSFSMRGDIQPEFYLTLPLGWELKRKKKKILGRANDLIQKYFKRINPQVEYDASLHCENPELKSEENEDHNLKLDSPFIKSNDKRFTYNYLVNAHEFKSLRDKIKDKSKSTFVFGYTSYLTFPIVGISLIQYFFLIFSLYILWRVIPSLNIPYLPVATPSSFNNDFVIGYLIALLSYTYYFVNLSNEGYEIPNKNHYPIIFFISLIAIMLSFFI